jgi:integral membrane sensor domain MASE1
MVMRGYPFLFMLLLFLLVDAGVHPSCPAFLFLRVTACVNPS